MVQVIADLEITPEQLADADIQLNALQVQKILRNPNIWEDNPFVKTDPHWILLCNRECGIVRLEKMNTTRLTVTDNNGQQKIYLIKILDNKETEKEYNCYLAYKSYDVCVPHAVVQLETKTKVLIRGPTTPQSIGDLVYAHFNNMMDECPAIPDKGDLAKTKELQSALYDKLITAFEGLERIRLWCESTDLKMPITLDNIDLNGRYMDFGDHNTGEHGVYSALADFCRLWSLTHRPIPKAFAHWFPVNQDLVHCNWLDKVLRVNNNLLNADTVATELFLDTDTGRTKQYFNNITGLSEIDMEAVEGCSDYTKNLYLLQDPGLRFRNPVLNIPHAIQKYSHFAEVEQNIHEVFYDEDTYNFFEKHMSEYELDKVFKYTYFQGDSGDVVTDLMLYDYQGRLFLQPDILTFLYKQTLKDFSECATTQRYTLEDCIPRNSSLGASHPTLRHLRQKTLYEVAPDNFIEELVELSSTTKLLFTTKVIQKFALTAKARARTVAACSMFSSTLFRALHKPVTANFVTRAQDPNSKIHHLIGVTKFHHGFDQYVKNRFGDLDNYNIFGSDYTKCDRSFPLVLRAAAASLLFELGGWEPETHHFHNEVHAFMLDMVECNQNLYNKPGGTSSGDATTAFANTLYNHMVHLLVQLQTLVTEKVNPKHTALKVAACKLWQTGDSADYSELLEYYNSECYRFNFLSDDSFILTKKDPSLPTIYEKKNFARKLETIIHTTVDEGKSWEEKCGFLHEFCSAEVRKVNGVYQYIPDKSRILAALIIHGKAYEADVRLIRVCALLSESAIFSEVDPPFWNTLWHYFEHEKQKFIEQFGCLPFPDAMCSQDFYKSLIHSESQEQENILMKVITDHGIQLQGASTTVHYKQCHTCLNPTVSVCEECPVAYPLCAYCAFDHYHHTGHRCTNLPKCSAPECEAADPACLNYSLIDGKFQTRCDDHKGNYAIPVVDHAVSCFRIPLAQQCVRLQSNVTALNKVLQNFADHDLFKWDYTQSRDFNCTKLLHESNLLEQYSEEAEEVFDYQVVDKASKTVYIKGARYGATTYCRILDDKLHQRLNCTVDPLGNGRFKLTFLDDSNRFANYSKITRTTVTPQVTNPKDFLQLKNSVFILGPPGTGKTTHFIENYFTKANEFNKVVYCAPTHKLVQDMDEALAHRSDVTVIKSKFNNRDYKHSTNELGKPIHLATVNIAQKCLGCTLLIDEASLLTPKQIINAVARVKPAKTIIVGDPFQLSPVTPLTDFHWDYKTFYLKQLVAEVRNLDTCYRCPSNIFNEFAGAYHKHNITFLPAKEGGEVFRTVIPNKGIQIDVEVLKEASKKACRTGVVITNYREAVNLAQAAGLTNVITIDSSQGLTAKRVAVIIFGTTKFSKVLNRLIVACSRATDELHLYAPQEIFDHIDQELKVQKFKPQAILTHQNFLKEAKLEEVANNIEATCVMDIEFFHCKNPNDNTKPNFLGLGEVNVLTSRQATVFIRPRYNRDGVFEQVDDDKIVVSKPWRYMMKHLPSKEQSQAKINTLLEFLAETTELTESPLIIVLYNGKNDLEALAEITFPAGKCIHCKHDGRFQSESGPVCQQHARKSRLTGLCGAKFYNIQRPGKLQSEHDYICNSYHGHAHAANVDVLMTSCLLADELIDITRPGNPTQDNWTKVNFSPEDVYNRLYGDKVFTKNTYLKVCRDPQLAVPSPPQDHTQDWVSKAGCRFREVRSCHPVSPILMCSACVDYYNKEHAAQSKMARLGYERNQQCYHQLSQQERQLKLSAEIVNLPDGTYLKLGAYSGRLYKLQGTIDQTIRKANTETPTPVPLTQVCVGLGITCTVGIVHPFYPCKIEDELESWDIPLVKSPIKWRYQIALTPFSSNTSPKYAAFHIGMNEAIFTNRAELPRFAIRRYVNNFLADLPPTLFSTGRLQTKQWWLFENEETKTHNFHIEHGEYNWNSEKIGGMHCFPKAFQETRESLVQVNFQQLVNKPLWHGYVVANRGLKLATSVCDVNSHKLLEKIEELASDVDCSKRTTISIDYQEIPLMIWADKGKLKTAYLQNNHNIHGSGQDVVPPKIKFSRNANYVLHNPHTITQFDKDEVLERKPATVYISTIDQPGNISKYVDICKFIAQEIRPLHNPRVLEVGSTGGPQYNNMPIGGIVLDYFFGNGTVDHYDIDPTNGCNGYFNIGINQARYDLILSDIWSETDDATELCVSYINDKLAKGGSIIWKTTRRFQVKGLNHIAKSFKDFLIFTTKTNSESSEAYVVFRYKHSQVQIPIEPDTHNILMHIWAHRLQYTAHVTHSALELDHICPMTPGCKVPEWMAPRLTTENWKTGKFKQE
ncbi:ORF1B [Veiled chameleon serpentovirus A]|nr:ORF1B [Veiled chameleon serpentovirus A]QRC47049.1 ORF1B [Veiled chameleon serpentovirus A]